MTRPAEDPRQPPRRCSQHRPAIARGQDDRTANSRRHCLTLRAIRDFDATVIPMVGAAAVARGAAARIAKTNPTEKCQRFQSNGFSQDEFRQNKPNSRHARHDRDFGRTKPIAPRASFWQNKPDRHPSGRCANLPERTQIE
jgi:hypothetical protein